MNKIEWKFIFKEDAINILKTLRSRELNLYVMERINFKNTQLSSSPYFGYMCNFLEEQIKYIEERELENQNQFYLITNKKR